MAIDSRIEFAEKQPLLHSSQSTSITSNQHAYSHSYGKAKKNDANSSDTDSELSVQDTQWRSLIWIVVILVLFHTLYFGLLRISALPKLVQDIVEADQKHTSEKTKLVSEDSAKLWGQMASVQSLCGLVAEPLWGIFSDKYGRRLALVGNAFGLMICTLIFASVSWSIPTGLDESNGLTHTWMLMWTGVLLLGCSSCQLTLTSAALSDVSPSSEVSSNFGLWGLALCIGSFLGPLAHNSLVGLTSSTMFLYLVVALCWAVVLGFIYFGMPETHAEEHHELPNPSVGKAYPVHASLRSQVEEQINSIFKVILFYTPTAMLCAINFLFGIGMEGFYTLYWFYMGHKGFETTATNSLYSLYSIAQGCVEAIILRILVHRYSESVVLIIGLSAVSGAFFGMAGVSTFTHVGSALAFLSLGTGLCYPLLYGLTSRHIKESQPEHLGAGMAAFRVVCIGAEITGQLSLTKLFHGLPDKSLSWLVAGASVGVGAIVCASFAWYEWRKRGRTY